jgi:hypothetical protein
MQWKLWLVARGAGLALWCVCGSAACGDDDDASGSDGGARSTGQRDAATRPPVVITPVQAVAGACTFMFTLNQDQFAQCTGFEQLETCARRQCELDLCVDQCTQFMTCLYESKETCDQECQPEEGCAECMSTLLQCAVTGTCLETLHCAKEVSGGYCDQLRACCERQTELREQCSLVAEATANLQGEQNCRYFLDTIPALSDASVPCMVVDAGTPK